MATVQDTIRELRESGYSQTRIARELSIPQPRISRWESGEAPESVDDAIKLVELLGKVRRRVKRCSPKVPE